MLKIKHAIYDKNDKLYAITNNWQDTDKVIFDILKEATLLSANSLTDTELKTLTLQQARTLKNERKSR